MRQGAGTFGLGDAMLAVGLAALVLATARASVPAAVAVAAILGMAAHRVAAVLRPLRAAGGTVGPGLWAGTWIASVGYAVLVVIFGAMVGGLAGWFAGLLVWTTASVLPGVSPYGPIVQVGLLAAPVAGLAATFAAVRALSRVFWPGPGPGGPPADVIGAREAT